MNDVCADGVEGDDVEASSGSRRELDAGAVEVEAVAETVLPFLPKNASKPAGLAVASDASSAFPGL